MVLNAEHLSLTLGAGRAEVLRDVSLQLDRGEVVLLEGSSGSGKTALGVTLCGLLPPWAGNWDLHGRIRLAGVTVEQGRWNSEAGILLENPWTQLSGMKETVREELAFPLECRGVSRGEIPEIVERYAMLLGVADLLLRQVHTLSGGELQRVLTAGALVTRPRFLFLDRPLTEIDFGFRRNLLDVIRSQVKEDGGGALLVEDPWLMPGERFSRVLRLDGGVLGEFGGEAANGEALPEKSVPRRNSPCGTLLRAEGLSFGYDPGRMVLEGVSFSIGHGEITFITGPNGAGKSTLGRILTGILRPHAGELFLDGISYHEIRQRDTMSRVGFALQNAGLHLSRSTVREELELAERWGHPPGPLTGILGLDRVLDTHPLELTQSGRKLLALALATGANRWVAVLDEPTQYQDGDGFRRIADAVRFLSGEGVAILLISHDPRLYREFPEAGEIALGR